MKRSQWTRRTALLELELDPSTSHEYTVDDFKRAYRQKVLRCHPDKTNGCDDDFIRVKEAYEYLITSTPDFDHTKFDYTDIDTKAVLRDMAKFFCKVVAEFMHDKQEESKEEEEQENEKEKHEQHKAEPQPQSTNSQSTTSNDECFYDSSTSFEVTLKIKVPLADLYTEEGKRLVYKYKHSDGTLKRQHVYVSFRDYSSRSVFHGKGDWDVSNNEYGDLVVEMRVTHQEPYVIDDCLNRLDLTRMVWMSIGDFYTGFEYTFDHFGESLTVKVDSPKTIYDCSCVVAGKGLKSRNDCDRGDLVILFKVDLSHHKTVNSDDDKSAFVNIVKELFPSKLVDG